ncbi:MAG: phosphomannose isomerase type II C-terminal cupin domain [Anaerolineales bacterium]|nr:phosphomannose isomerase type II C-terminal cupin domain [Anaerolineales bacterium]
MSHYITKPIPAEKPAVQFVERPWGAFSQYANNEDVTVSLMTVKPGQRLSLQSHTGRAELWIALDDGAIVQVNDDIFYPKAGDEIWIPANARHRLGSNGPAVRVLEVAFGNWQQEDITRYEDDFDRPEQGE